MHLIPCFYGVFLAADVHGVHPHGPAGEEAESEPCGERTREGERHGEYKRSAGPRQEEEKQEMLLNKRKRESSRLSTEQTPSLLYFCTESSESTAGGGRGADGVTGKPL